VRQLVIKVLNIIDARCNHEVRLAVYKMLKSQLGLYTTTTRKSYVARLSESSLVIRLINSWQIIMFILHYK